MKVMLIIFLSLFLFSCSAGTLDGNTYLNSGGSRKVDIKGQDDDFETKIEVSTYNYDYWNPTGMRIFKTFRKSSSLMYLDSPYQRVRNFILIKLFS